MQDKRREDAVSAETFDRAFYLIAYPDVKACGLDPLEHYVAYGRGEGRAATIFAPSFEGGCSWDEMKQARSRGLFDEVYYRGLLGGLPDDLDPFVHYILIGSKNYVAPSAIFDPIYYLARNADARSSGLSPLIHYLRHGHGRAALPDGTYHWAEASGTNDQDVHIDRLKAASFFYRYDLGADGDGRLRWRHNAVAHLAGRTGPMPETEPDVEPQVSIIVPVYGQLPFVLNCLDSLVDHLSKYSFEVIVMDDASPVGEQIGCIDGLASVRYIHGGINRGFLGACNYAANFARGKYLVLLNSDTRVCFGWLDELIDTFIYEPDAGFVGSKLYNSDGSLQEAGAIVWEDGSAWNYGRDDDPARSQYGYARQVDYCSGAAIALPTDLWMALGGFDDHFAPAYYEDVDIAFRVRAAGRQVWYQALARVIHYEGVTHGKDVTKGVKAVQVINAGKFGRRWRDALRGYGVNGQKPLENANRHCTKRMLAIDAVTPTPDRDAGSVMTVKLLEIYRKMGWHITFAPIHDPRFERDYSARLQRVGIEVISDPGHIDPIAHLSQRPDFYEAVLGFRVTVVAPIVDRIRAAAPAALVMFHDIDLHYLRMQREAEIKGQQLLARQAEVMKTDELELCGKVDCVIVPSTVEKDIVVAEIAIPNVAVYSYTADAVDSVRTFDERCDLVFVGGFRHSPNVDAMEFFINQVWPTLMALLPDRARFLVVGADAPENLTKLANDRIVFTGYVEDIAPVLEDCRVFVAPLRYGAGLKGKVVTSLSHGVPCVASAIAIEGMALDPETQVLQADTAAQFVDQILRVYNDATLWSRLRAAGYDFVNTQYSIAAGSKVAEEILTIAETAWLARNEKQRAARFAKLQD